MKRSQLWELCFGLLVVGTALPLWLTRYLPIEDLPQHLAAVRVLHSYHDPRFGFAQYFELGLSRTQYLAYYLAADWLSYLFDLELANRLLITGCVVATAYALRSLLRALGRDERYALFALPFTYNAHLILGFVNFLWAIPLSFWGLALCVRQRREYRSSRGLALAGVALLCFYSHVVPFALLSLGALLIALQRELRATVRMLVPLLPAGVAGVFWAVLSPAGQATVTAAHGSTSGRVPSYQPWRMSWNDLPGWLTEVLGDQSDRYTLRALGALLVLALVIGLFRKRSAAANDALGRSLTLRLWALPLLAALLYFVAPTSYDWIWPISQRFGLLAVLLLIPVLPRPPRHAGHMLIALLLGVTLLHTRAVAQAFRGFDHDEVGDFDQALEAIPPQQRVAGLIYLRSSRFVRFSPFIHYVAYYQARKGGAVMFTFADFPQSPFRFREDNRPPRVPPRWEWLPERVRPIPDLRWYDYVLARGGPGLVAQPSQGWSAVYRGPLWSVWKKVR